MSLSDSEAKAYALIQLLGKEGELAPKLDEMVKAREQAEAALAKVREEKEALDLATKASSEQLAKERAELDKAKASHDESAEEARKRINLNRSQQAELDELKEKLDKQEQNLSLREAQVADAEKRVERQTGALRAAIEHVNRLKPAVNEVQGIAQSMKEALG